MVAAALAVAAAGFAIPSLGLPAILSSLALLLSGCAVFVMPGVMVLAAMSTSLRRAGTLAFAFAISLVLLTATFAACLAAQTTIAAAPVVLGIVTLGAALLSRRFAPALPAAPRSASPSSVLSRVVLALLVAACVACAVAFAPVGSIDRWLYLAYVRGFLDAPVLTLAEPFLGTGQSFARFGVHPWLFGLAAWSWLSGFDPVLVYERGAPVLVVLASVSATSALASTLFGEGSRSRLTVVATMLLWSGAMVPLLARAGEDKVMAASALLPLGIVAFLRVTRGREGRAALLLLLVAAVATAAVHALAYAFLLVALLPLGALIAIREPGQRRAVVTAVALLLAVAVAPAISGIIVRDRLHDIGAELASGDHPVVRVHEGRERLVKLPVAGYVVSPRLLLHPLALLALAGLPLLLRRKGGLLATANDFSERGNPLPCAASASDALLRGDLAGTTLYLVVATVVPLAIALLPPLPRLAGTVIPPWMVYRVLWLVPLAPLAAIAAEGLASRFARREAMATLLLLALGLPLVAGGVRDRLAEVRGRLAAPAGADFHDLVGAIAVLPGDALLVAAPELSERLPAFTARAVVAALDRSTIVFAGSRERGEARLRARAALLSGADDAFALAAAAGVEPTHAVFDARASDKPDCDAVLFRSQAWTLCRLVGMRGRTNSTGVATMFDQTAELPKHEAPDHHEPGKSGRLDAPGNADASGNADMPGNADAYGQMRELGEAVCDATPKGPRRDPWSAVAPVAHCRLAIPAGSRGRGGLFLRIATITARATDELRVTAQAAGWPDGGRHTAVRVTDNAVIVLPLPPIDAEAIDVRIASSFLPSIRVARVSLAAR